MKQFWIALAAILMTSFVAATNSQIVPESITVAPSDVKVTEFCVQQNGEALPGVAVTVFAVCRDTNSLVGCQPDDAYAGFELSVIPLDAVTDADGCATIQLVSTHAHGSYYYSVMGQVGEAIVTVETGSADVPEMSTVGAAVALTLGGLLVWRKTMK